MSQRIAFAFALAVIAGCGSNPTKMTNDMAAGTGTDMTMVMTTTIAAAVQGKITTPITVTAIVTAIVGDGSASWYIQDPAGGAYSGVAVYCDAQSKSKPCTLKAPALHDQITITGTLSQYHGKWELNPTAQMTTMANATPATPMAVSDADAAFNQTNAGLRGIPVKLMGSSFTVDNIMPPDLYDTQCKGDGGAGAMNLCTGCKPPSYAGFEVSDGTNKIYVEQTFYATVPLVSSPECVAAAPMADQVIVGSKFTALGGILDVDPYGPKGSTIVSLQPTAMSDYQ
jgi:predicted extracellular nuclease